MTNNKRFVPAARFGPLSENEKKREKELRIAFDRWYVRKYRIEAQREGLSVGTDDDKSALFEAYVGGADSNVPKNFFPPDPQYIGELNWEKNEDPLEAFPKISVERPLIQYRLYSETFNEHKIRIGSQVQLWASPEDGPDPEYPEKDDYYVLGARVVQFQDLPEQHQSGIVNHYKNRFIHLGDETWMFVFWLRKLNWASWGNPDWKEEQYDITDS